MVVDILRGGCGLALRLVGKALIETISWHVPVARTGLAACRSTPRGDSQQAHDEVLKEGADWIKAPSEDPRRDDLSCEVYDDAAQRSSFSCATGRAPVYKASQSFLSKPPGPGRSPPPTSIHRPICQPCLVYTLGVKEERIPQRLTVFFSDPCAPCRNEAGAGPRGVARIQDVTMEARSGVAADLRVRPIV